MSGGSFIASSGSIGEANQPIYLNNGVLTTLSGAIGSSSKPMYMTDDGHLEASTYSIGYIDTISLDEGITFYTASANNFTSSGDIWTASKDKVYSYIRIHLGVLNLYVVRIPTTVSQDSWGYLDWPTAKFVWLSPRPNPTDMSLGGTALLQDIFVGLLKTQQLQELQEVMNLKSELGGIQLWGQMRALYLKILIYIF